jgi:transcriptional regulator with XRE-family HTH domain
MKNRNETFGRLLKAGIASIANCEGKTAAVIEDDLGQEIGVSADTIQRYKSGFTPPDDQTIKVLAEAAVQRGFLGREWLQRFLHAARYPFADRLLDELCPAPQVRPRPSRIYENLPAPTYSQFVMRQQAFTDVLDGLAQRSATVLIVGLGGNGKTSLAREVAARCLRADDGVPHFDAVVWVSDKDRPSATNLSVVLDEIARTLDYCGFTQLVHDDKRREVEQLLRRQRVLLIVDNFETITDGALPAWLLRLPEPSKALVTTREYHREWRSSWPVELRGMSEAEAQTLITQRLRILQLSQHARDPVQFEPLITITGGNPKAIEIALGLVKHERRPLREVVDDLYAARGELFDDLFARGWALLDEAARRVLLSMALFPDRASPESLRAAADVWGFAFDRAVERLTDLALLDTQRLDLDRPPRYVLHPLVRAFATAKLATQPELEAAARIRWATDLEQRVLRAMAQEPYSDLPLLDESDLAARAFLDWAERTSQWNLFLTIYKQISALWSIRGRFDVREHYTVRAIAVARAAGLREQVVNLLASLSRLKSYLSEDETADRLLAEALTLRSELPSDPALLQMDRTLVLTQATRLLYTEQPAAALNILTHYPDHVRDVRAQNQHTYWVGRCLIRLEQILK